MMMLRQRDTEMTIGNWDKSSGGKTAEKSAVNRPIRRTMAMESEVAVGNSIRHQGTRGLILCLTLPNTLSWWCCVCVFGGLYGAIISAWQMCCCCSILASPRSPFSLIVTARHSLWPLSSRPATPECHLRKMTLSNTVWWRKSISSNGRQLETASTNWNGINHRLRGFHYRSAVTRERNKMWTLTIFIQSYFFSFSDLSSRYH